MPQQLRDPAARITDPCPNRGLVLVDLQAVSLRRRAAEMRDSQCGAAAPQAPAPLDWRRSRRNLVTVNLYFSQHATRADRRRFWRHYLLCRPGLLADPRSAARHLEEQTDRAARRFWRKRDRRCLRQGRYFYCCARRGARALAVRDLPEAALEALLNQPDAPFETAHAQILKHSSGSQVARLKLPDGPNGIPCVYKRWQPRSLRERLMSRLRTSKAMHAWRMGHALLARGIATPRPLAVIEGRSRAPGSCCYLLWEEIENAQHLHDAAECLSAMSPMARRRAASPLATRLARLLRRLHDAGFDHRDLKAANILVQGPPETPEGIYLLDLDAVRRRRRTVDVTRRLRDLSRLLVSFYRSSTVTRSAKLSCFDNYLHGGLESHEDWKARCRQMDRLAQRKIRRNQRRGRVIA